MKALLLSALLVLGLLTPAAAVDVDTVAMLGADTGVFLCDGTLHALEFTNSGTGKSVYLAQHNDSFSTQGVAVLDVQTVVKVNGLVTDVLMESLGSVNATPSRAQGPAASWPNGAVIRQNYRCISAQTVAARSQLWIWVGANQVP